MRRRETPTDELTGIPLPILPDDERLLDRLTDPALRNITTDRDGRVIADWNHAYHPRGMPDLTSEDGKAVREIRGQLVLRSDHDEYHAQYAGPPLPQTIEERFGAIVICASGYVPRKAIALKGDSPKEVTMSDSQVNRLRTSGELRVMQSSAAKDFLQKYILTNPVTDHIPEWMTDKFIKLGNLEACDTVDDSKWRLFLGDTLLKMVIQPAVDPLKEVYGEIRRDSIWYHGMERPVTVISHQILGRGLYARMKNIRDVSIQLRDVLAKQRDGELTAA